MSLVLLDSAAHDISIYRRPGRDSLLPFELAGATYDADTRSKGFSRRKAQKYVTEQCGKGVVMPDYR
jgi:hypothetical protein